jgi:hypothetical protein
VDRRDLKRIITTGHYFFVVNIFVEFLNMNH